MYSSFFLGSNDCFVFTGEPVLTNVFPTFKLPLGWAKRRLAMFPPKRIGAKTRPLHLQKVALKLLNIYLFLCLTTF